MKASKNINISLPKDLEAQVKTYQKNHPEFNLSGYIAKTLRKLMEETV